MLEQDNQNANPKILSHEDAWALVPWLVNGSLDAAEAQKVRAHCRQCDACRRELRRQTQLAALIGGSDPIDVELEEAWTRFQTELSETTRRGAPTGQSTARKNGRRAPRPRVAAARVGAALAASLGVAMIFAHVSDNASLRTDLNERAVLSADGSNAAAFRTVTTPGKTGVLLRLRAVEGASPDALAALFRANDLVVVDGPSREGVYTLRAAARPHAQEAARALENSAAVALVLVGG